MAPTFLVTGATGFQGGSTARLLLSQGYQVNAFVRNPSSPASLAFSTLGAKLFQGTYTDLPSIIAATNGVTGIFLNTFPDFTNPRGEVPQAENFITAAKASGTVQTIVCPPCRKQRNIVTSLLLDLMSSEHWRCIIRVNPAWRTLCSRVVFRISRF
jgi:NAD(P)-dependent dehydrogenase (short-subunit alcohol dehydrogenase family)